MAESKKTTKSNAETSKAKKPTKASKGEVAQTASRAAVGALARVEAVSESTPASAEAAAKPENPARSKKVEATPPAPPPESLSLSADEIEKPKIVKAKGSKNIHAGIAHVLSTFNNTIVTITDMSGNVIGWSSAGKVGFKGS